MTIRVLLADDHSVLRDGLAALLGAQDGITVVAHAQDGREAVRKATELKPDVAIVDIVMPELDGIEATRLLQRSSPQTQIVILSMHSTTEHIYRALQAGAKGYLLKESAGAELVAGIRSVHAGRRYLSQKITETVVDDYIRRSPAFRPGRHAEQPRATDPATGGCGQEDGGHRPRAISIAQDRRYLSQSPHAEARYRQCGRLGPIRDRLRVDPALRGLARGSQECLTPTVEVCLFCPSACPRSVRAIGAPVQRFGRPMQCTPRSICHYGDQP